MTITITIQGDLPEGVTPDPDMLAFALSRAARWAARWPDSDVDIHTSQREGDESGHPGWLEWEMYVRKAGTEQHIGSRLLLQRGVGGRT